MRVAKSHSRGQLRQVPPKSPQASFSPPARQSSLPSQHPDGQVTAEHRSGEPPPVPPIIGLPASLAMPHRPDRHDSIAAQAVHVWPPRPHRVLVALGTQVLLAPSQQVVQFEGAHATTHAPPRQIWPVGQLAQRLPFAPQANVVLPARHWPCARQPVQVATAAHTPASQAPVHAVHDWPPVPHDSGASPVTQRPPESQHPEHDDGSHRDEPQVLDNAPSKMTRASFMARLETTLRSLGATTVGGTALRA